MAKDSDIPKPLLGDMCLKGSLALRLLIEDESNPGRTFAIYLSMEQVDQLTKQLSEGRERLLKERESQSVTSTK